MNLTEITYTKIKYIIRRFATIRQLSFLSAKTERNSGRSMLSQSKKVLCICVAFQESHDLLKEEPETNVYDMTIDHIGGHFKTI